MRRSRRIPRCIYVDQPRSWWNDRLNLPLVCTGIQLNVGARKVSRNAVTGEKDGTWLILSKWLGELEEEWLKYNTASQTGIAVEVGVGDLRPAGTVVTALGDDEILSVWGVVCSSGQ